MDWNLLKIVVMIFFGALFAVLAWGSVRMWKTSKFLAVVFFVIAAAVAIAFYAIYGKDIFG